ncbi:MAG: hypothetical protein H0U35_06630, partial [Sporichthyaceae bacterium]|nr:hypothetical protein [Sporichthyaceae bacterium]
MPSTATPTTLASAMLSGDTRQAGDAVATLIWGLRRYAWLVVLCIVAFGVLLPLQQLTKTPTFTSEAIVVAADLTADLKVLPRFGEAVFDNGQVARRITEEFGDGGDLEDVVPRRVSVVTEQDSLVFRVQGHARDAQVSADIANAAASVFATELNKPGSGVGAFVVQNTAIPPVESDEPLRAAPYSVSVGGVAGLVAGLGAVMLLLVLRRPVVDAAAATRATDLPVFGSVIVPRVPRTGEVRLDEVAGLAPLCRQVLDWSPEAVLLTGPDRLATARQHLARALSGAFEHIRQIAGPPVVAPKRRDPEDSSTAAEGVDGPERTPISVIDGSSSIDLVAPGPKSFVLLVIPVGIGMSALRSLAGELRGVPAAI